MAMGAADSELGSDVNKARRAKLVQIFTCQVWLLIAPHLQDSGRTSSSLLRRHQRADIGLILRLA